MTESYGFTSTSGDRSVESLRRDFNGFMNLAPQLIDNEEVDAMDCVVPLILFMDRIIDRLERLERP